MSLALTAILLATMVGTSFLSGIFGMAGGLILVGVLLAILPLPAAMMLHGVTQLASNLWRASLWWRHIRWRPVAPTPLALPNTPNANSNKDQRQWHPQTEVRQPKLEKWSDDAVPCFLQQQTRPRRRSPILRPEPEERRGEFGRILSPSGMPLQHRCCAELVSS